MATPPMTHVGQATAGSKSMVPTASTMPAAAPTVEPSKPTASAVKPTASTAPAVKSTAPTSAATSVAAPGDCRSVRDDAKCANCNACRHNTYRSLRHGTLPTRNSKAVGVADLRFTTTASRHEFLDVTVPH